MKLCFALYCDWLRNCFPVRHTRPTRTKKYKQVQSEVAGGFSPFGSDLPCQAFGKISSFYSENALFSEMKIARRGEK